MVTEERLQAVTKTPALLANTQTIIDSCDFKYDFEIPKIKNIIPTPPKVLRYLQH
jgi:DNA polymerase-3 subunit alpha/error-prone DNA polymerase